MALRNSFGLNDVLYWYVQRHGANDVTYVDAVKVVGVHDGTLVELDLSEVSLEEALQLQVRFLPETEMASAMTSATASATVVNTTSYSRNTVI